MSIFTSLFGFLEMVVLFMRRDVERVRKSKKKRKLSYFLVFLDCK